MSNASDWRARRDRILASAKRIVVKVGSAVLADRKKGVNAAIVAGLAAQFAELAASGRQIVVVSSGAVAAGREAIAQGYDPSSVPHRQAASAIGQSRLMHAYDQELEKRGLAAAQVLLTRDDLESRERYLNLRNTLNALLDLGAVPIINENDSVAVQELVYGDNDCLASLLVGVTGAELMVNLTSARGVFAENPDANPDAERIPCVENIAGLDLDGMCGGKTLLGTGGMYSKLLAAKRAAHLGVPTLILCGKEPESLGRAFAGGEEGTWVCPEERSMSSRKYWLAYNLEPKGAVSVDAGAARALTMNGRSLLPAGIVDVSGDFLVGDPVRIMLAEGKPVGVGLSNYCASDLRKIMGMKSANIAQILGHASFPEAIHRDNLVLENGD